MNDEILIATHDYKWGSYDADIEAIYKIAYNAGIEEAARVTIQATCINHAHHLIRSLEKK